ncbi:MAG: Gfo/Idh/MocA family oxidoreductase [Nakamurella sp.]
MRIGLAGAGRIGAFHAATLQHLPAVEQVLITDAVADHGARVAAGLGAEFVDSFEALLAAAPDALVITTPTATHADLIIAAVDAGIPTFCEKPVAASLERTVEVVRYVEAGGVTVQIGFQRRFDAGFRAAAAAVASGELGFVHHLHALTGDAAPPPAAYIPMSGGFFRDCNVHDFDAVRFVTGHEVISVHAVGANRGEQFFRDADDIDSAAAILTLDDGTLATVIGTRYNAAGYDVRMEVLGSAGSVAVGLDQHTALRSAEPGTDFPVGPSHPTFMERFLPAYVSELTAFTRVVAGLEANPCTVRDGLQAFRIAEAADRSRRSGQTVLLSDVPDA